ncbi:hypothetical protein V1291_000479 [Nitrobacteraceae bacterium AZCC 1564]
MRLLFSAGLVLLGVALGGCSIPLADLPLVGVPANTPARPATPPSYLPVHDLPPPRDDAVLTPEQQAKLEKDLAAARDRQASGSQAAQRRND